MTAFNDSKNYQDNKDNYDKLLMGIEGFVNESKQYDIDGIAKRLTHYGLKGYIKTQKNIEIF